MSSRGKKKTTMAKLNREAKLRERRSEKAARKEARRDAAENGTPDELTTLESPDTEDDFGPDESEISVASPAGMPAAHGRAPASATRGERGDRS